MNRDCNKCIYSTRDGNCRKWECEETKTVEQHKIDSVKEFAKWLIDKKVSDYSGIVDLVVEYLGD